MRIRGVVFLILLFCLPAQNVLAKGAREARDLFISGDYELAAERFSEEVSRRPDDGRVRYNLALALHMAGEHERAEELFLEAMTLDKLPPEEKVMYNLGNNLFRQAEDEKPARSESALELYRKALQYYRRAIQLDREDEDAAFNYEYTLRRIEDLKAAMEKMPEEFPEVPEKTDEREEPSPKEEREEEEPAPKEEREEEDPAPEEEREEEDPTPEERDDPDEDERPDQEPETQKQEESFDFEERAPEDMQDTPQPELELPEEGMSEEMAEFLLRMQREEEERKRFEEKQERRERGSQEVIRDW